MERLEPLGRRDIFGILLPGAILVFISTYALSGVIALLQLPIKDLLEREFLLTAILFVTAYLAGSLLRLFAADDVDKESSERLVKEWQTQHHVRTIKAEYEEWEAELARGSNKVDVGHEFDDWLYRTESFPYPAWQNRKWQAQGLHEVLEFYRSNYLNSMWPVAGVSPKTFFNYCKLIIVSNGGGLADEVNMAEALTRFFAGTVIAFRISIWLVTASLVVQLLLIAMLTFGSRWGVQSALSVNWTLQGFHLALAFILIVVLRQIRQMMVKRFRHVRAKEVETVYHAFYLYSTRDSSGKKS